MKKLFSFLAILGIILASNCSRIPENNDPVIGIWTDAVLDGTNLAAKGTFRKEWIFNDAYLGRYHEYNGTKIEVLTDFQWRHNDGVYTISYPGLDNKTEDIVTMEQTETGTVLRFGTGEVLAIRE